MPDKSTLELWEGGILAALTFIIGAIIGWLPKIMDFMKQNRDSKIETKSKEQTLEQQNNQFLLNQLQEQYRIIAETAKTAQLEHRKTLTENASLEIKIIQLMQEKAVLEIEVKKLRGT